VNAKPGIVAVGAPLFLELCLRGLIMWRRWSRHGWVPRARAAHRRLRRAALES
jgi:hypothetical protein